MMLKHTEILMDKVRNPYKYNINVADIQEHIDIENYQHGLNALIEWVLNTDK